MNTTEIIAEKFRDPERTATGKPRASVDWRGLKTLWLNTGTLCNIECVNCYIESSPGNDKLVYLRRADILPYLDEIRGLDSAPVEIGITGGEPFLCPEILDIMEACLEQGHRLLVLTNAMRPMMRPRIQQGLLALHRRFGEALTLRISLDHHTALLHDTERGTGSFDIAMKGLAWIAQSGINAAIAGRQMLNENDEVARKAYGALIARIGLSINPADTSRLVLFPEMIPGDDPSEITTDCWEILGKDPSSIMCADQRMVVKRKGETHAVVTACTLLAYDRAFEFGRTLAEATAQPVPLNHPWCASFCVLGGGSCSA